MCLGVWQPEVVVAEMAMDDSEYAKMCGNQMGCLEVKMIAVVWQVDDENKDQEYA